MLLLIIKSIRKYRTNRESDGWLNGKYFIAIPNIIISNLQQSYTIRIVCRRFELKVKQIQFDILQAQITFVPRAISQRQCNKSNKIRLNNQFIRFNYINFDNKNKFASPWIWSFVEIDGIVPLINLFNWMSCEIESFFLWHLIVLHERIYFHFSFHLIKFTLAFCHIVFLFLFCTCRFRFDSKTKSDSAREIFLCAHQKCTQFKH